MVGAGDTAAEEATYLAKLCTKVTMLVRRDEMRASKAMQKRVFNTDNITVLFNQTKSINGEKGVESVTAYNNITNEETDICNWLFCSYWTQTKHRPIQRSIGYGQRLFDS